MVYDKCCLCPTSSIMGCSMVHNVHDSPSSVTRGWVPQILLCFLAHYMNFVGFYDQKMQRIFMTIDESRDFMFGIFCLCIVNG